MAEFYFYIILYIKCVTKSQRGSNLILIENLHKFPQHTHTNFPQLDDCVFFLCRFDCDFWFNLLNSQQQLNVKWKMSFEKSLGKLFQFYFIFRIRN